jgi:hypothetical protein
MLLFNRYATRIQILGIAPAIAWFCLGAGVAQAGKKARRSASLEVSERSPPEVLVLCTRPYSRPPAPGGRDDYLRRMATSYFRRMETSAKLMQGHWWGNLRLQADAEQVTRRAGEYEDGFVWVRRPSLHKRVRFGNDPLPRLDFGAVRDSEAARYRCDVGTYDDFHEQHQRADLTPLDVLAIIDSYMDPGGQAKKEQELAQVFLDGKREGRWARITASYVSEDKGLAVDALHFQYPDGRALCFSVLRPLFETESTRRAGESKAEGFLHTRDERGLVRQTALRRHEAGQPKGPLHLPSPQEVRQLLDGIQLAERQAPLNQIAARILGLR